MGKSDDHWDLVYGIEAPFFELLNNINLGRLKPQVRVSPKHLFLEGPLSFFFSRWFFLTLLQIKDSPCLAGSPAGDQVEKKDKRLKHHWNSLLEKWKVNKV